MISYAQWAVNWPTSLGGDGRRAPFTLEASSNASDDRSFLQGHSICPEEAPPVLFLGKAVLNNPSIQSAHFHLIPLFSLLPHVCAWALQLSASLGQFLPRINDLLRALERGSAATQSIRGGDQETLSDPFRLQGISLFSFAGKGRHEQNGP